jgi:hypothetical protein
VDAININEMWVDVGILHPIALLSMAIAFAFCFLVSWWMLSRLFVKHKKLCMLLLFLLFVFVTLVSPIVTLTYLHNAFVAQEASSVGLGGSPFEPVFFLLPPIGGMFLAARLFHRKNNKLRNNAISEVSEVPVREDSKDGLS